MTFFETLKKIDQFFFMLINHDADHRILDPIMIIIRNPFTWIPLYLFMIYFIFKKFGKRAWSFVLLTIVTLAITDCTTGLLLEPLIGRLRPYYDPVMHQYVRALIDYGSKYSFPSSQAANHFGLAAFWFWSLWTMIKRKWTWLWIWAALISYAQVYVGQHYPIDVLCGALFGWFIGTIIAKVFEYIWKTEITNHKLLNLNFRKNYSLN